MTGEWLHSFEPEEYDQKIYALLVMGWLVAQKEMFNDDFLIYNNPEKFCKPEVPDKEPKPERHPLQGEFILLKPWTNKL